MDTHLFAPVALGKSLSGDMAGILAISSPDVRDTEPPAKILLVSSNPIWKGSSMNNLPLLIGAAMVVAGIAVVVWIVIGIARQNRQDRNLPD